MPSPYEKNYENLMRLLGEREHTELEIGGYMPLVVEKVSNNEISLCHYGEQNGDPMRDPEVCFLLDGNTAKPGYFRNDYIAMEYATVPDQFGDAPIKPHRQRDLDNFVAMWFSNLQKQGFFEKAQELTTQQQGKPDQEGNSRTCAVTTTETAEGTGANATNSVEIVPKRAPEKLQERSEINYKNLMQLLGEDDSREVVLEGHPPLAAERLQGTPLITLCAYDVQNGDLIRHAEVTFRVDTDKATPVYYRNDLLPAEHATVAECVEEHFGAVPIKPERQEVLEEFVSEWWDHIRSAGFLDKAQELQAKHIASPAWGVYKEQIRALVEGLIQEVDPHRQQTEKSQETERVKSYEVEVQETWKYSQTFAVEASCREQAQERAKAEFEAARGSWNDPVPVQMKAVTLSEDGQPLSGPQHDTERSSHAPTSSIMPGNHPEDHPVTETNEPVAGKNARERKPEAKLACGDVRGSVWVNQSEERGEFLSVSIARVYKAKDGTMKTTHSFRQQDLPDVIELAQGAQKIIQEEMQKRGLEATQTQRLKISR